jgi:tetratricopeptide (TPR) repeat protein
MTANEKITAAREALLNGELKTAEVLYLDILREDTVNLCALDGLGIIQCQQGETSAGIQYFYDALYQLRKDTGTEQPRLEATILFHIGLAYRSLGYNNEALKVLTEASAFAPEEPDLLLNLGQLYFDLEQFAEAIGAFRSLTFVQPDNASAWLTLGYILYQREQYNEAAEALQAAELLDENSPEICLYLAESLRKAERYEDSLVHYQKMLQVGNEYPQAVHSYGKALLSAGQLADGWDAMEFRFLSQSGTWERHQLPNWSPENTNSSSVLAYSEEGIAADLMYASCLPNLINAVDRCVIECDTALHKLFKRSFPRAEFVALPHSTVDEQKNPWDMQLDAQIAFGSLPRHFRRDRYDFPLRKAYLVPDKDKVTKWSNKLAEIGDAKKVGILWQGHWSAETDKQMTLPIMPMRRLIAKHMNVCFVNLQNGSAQNSLGQRNGMNPRLYREIFQYDLDEMAAMLTALDLVITPPGYAAHLAGALGVTTWLMLPAGADWRHTVDICHADKTASLWHTTMTVYRQQTGQHWDEVFKAMENDFETFIGNKRPPELELTEAPMTLVFPQQQTQTAKRTAA